MAKNESIKVKIEEVIQKLESLEKATQELESSFYQEIVRSAAYAKGKRSAYADIRKILEGIIDD